MLGPLRYAKVGKVTLRLRLIVSIGVALLASLALGAALTFWHAGYKVQTEVQAAIAVGAHVAQSAIDDSEQQGTNRRDRITQLIGEFDGDRHLRASLLDRDNLVLLASTPEPPTDAAPAWFQKLLGGEPRKVQVSLPVEFGNYGSVVLATDASNELAEAWDDTGLALAVLATFCMLVLGVVYWTLARALRPLQDLSVAFARVGRGDYGSSVPENGPVELARIGREFNQMVEHLSTVRRQNSRLNVQLRNVQEEERAGLARELHDEIGPFLFAVGLDVSSIHQIAKTDRSLQLVLEPRLEAIRDAVAHMQKHLKVILGRLRPIALFDLGLSHAIDNIVDFWRARYPNVTFDVRVCRESLGEPLENAVYQIVRESLSNALRHGHPSRIEIEIELADGHTIAANVSDDGGGMPPAGSTIGFGITGMQERAALLGGTLSVCDRIDTKGVVVSARLPLDRPAEGDPSKSRETVSA
jgi:two-component system, NarL family, sensor histidine kinase UhpB